MDEANEYLFAPIQPESAITAASDMFGKLEIAGTVHFRSAVEALVDPPMEGWNQEEKKAFLLKAIDVFKLDWHGRTTTDKEYQSVRMFTGQTDITLLNPNLLLCLEYASGRRFKDIQNRLARQLEAYLTKTFNIEMDMSGRFMGKVKILDLE